MSKYFFSPSCKFLCACFLFIYILDQGVVLLANFLEGTYDPDYLSILPETIAFVTMLLAAPLPFITQLFGLLPEAFTISLFIYGLWLLAGPCSFVAGAILVILLFFYPEKVLCFSKKEIRYGQLGIQDVRSISYDSFAAATIANRQLLLLSETNRPVAKIDLNDFQIEPADKILHILQKHGKATNVQPTIQPPLNNQTDLNTLTLKAHSYSKTIFLGHTAIALLLIILLGLSITEIVVAIRQNILFDIIILCVILSFLSALIVKWLLSLKKYIINNRHTLIIAGKYIRLDGAQPYPWVTFPTHQIAYASLGKIILTKNKTLVFYRHDNKKEFQFCLKDFTSKDMHTLTDILRIKVPVEIE